MLSKELKEQIINDYKLHEGDTGSPEVQIALLTYRINSVNEHLKAHKKRPSFKKRIIKNGRTKKRTFKIFTRKRY